LLEAIGSAAAGVLIALYEVVKITAAVTAFVALLDILFDPRGAQRVGNLLANIVSGASKVTLPLLAQLRPTLTAVAQQFSTAVGNDGTALAGTMLADFKALAAQLLAVQRQAFGGGGESTPANAINNAAAGFEVAFGAGLSSAAVAALFESIFPEKLNTLNGVAPMIAKMAGFDEVAAEVLGPLYKNAFGRSLEYLYKSQFKPEYPDEGDAVTWHARRLLTDAQLQTIFGVSGLKQEYETPYVASAYRAVQPRALATLFQDTDVPVAAMQAALQFAGIRDQEIALMLPAFVWNATKNVRGEYISALVRSAELGTLSMQELTQELTTLGYSAAASDLIQLTVATRKELQLAELYRKSISEAYRYGTITDAQYVPSLEAIGISAADAQAHYAVDSIAKQGKAALAALKAEERLAAQRMRAAGQAAIAGYKSGTLDAAALEAALLLAGYDPAVAGFAVTVQTLKREGNEVFVYGVTLPRSAAVLLREQVSALGVQVKAQLVTPAAALQALAGYGVPAANAQALVADWAATVTPAADVGVLEPR
jgi:hypothetical protein